MAHDPQQPAVSPPGQAATSGHRWKAGTGLAISLGTCLAYIGYAFLIPHIVFLGWDAIIQLTFLGEIPVAAGIVFGVLGIADRRENKVIAGLALALALLASGAPGIFLAALIDANPYCNGCPPPPGSDVGLVLYFACKYTVAGMATG